jgi:hypothetical protein
LTGELQEDWESQRGATCLMEEGGGGEESKKAWSSINHSILSALLEKSDLQNSIFIFLHIKDHFELHFCVEQYIKVKKKILAAITKIGTCLSQFSLY